MDEVPWSGGDGPGHVGVGRAGLSLRGALIAIVALTGGFPLAPFGWSGARRPLP